MRSQAKESFPQRFGPYVLVSAVGEGGMARVYRAVRQGPMGFRKELAIKRIRTDLTKDNEELARALVNEARLGGQLRHPNVVDTYEFGTLDDQYYIAMEYVNGLTLGALIEGARRRGVQLPVAVVLDLAIQICEGLEYAHNVTTPDGKPLGLVHRDLKPANIIVSTVGQARIMDFGIARSAAAMYRTTANDTAKGTLNFMSPEQLQDPRALDHRSDLFAVGAILFEGLTGKPLMNSPTLESVMWMIVSGSFQPRLLELEDTLPGLRPVVARCLHVDREARYASAAELGTALSELHATVGGGRGCRDMLGLLSAWKQGDTAEVERIGEELRVQDERSDSDSGWSSFVRALREAEPAPGDPYEEGGIRSPITSVTTDKLPSPPVAADPSGDRFTVVWQSEDATELMTSARVGKRRPRGRLLAIAGIFLIAAMAAMAPRWFPPPDEEAGEPTADGGVVLDAEPEASADPAGTTPPLETDVVEEPPPVVSTPPEEDLAAAVEPRIVEERRPREEPAEPREPTPATADSEPVAFEDVRLVLNADPWAYWTMSGDAEGSGRTPYIADLPPGQYRFQLREGVTGAERAMTVVLTGAEPDVNRCWSFSDDGPC